MYRFNTIEEALDDIRIGKALVVVDDENRENEGDLVVAAEKASPEIINFMVKHAGGLVCMPMTAERLNELQINPMVAKNTDSKQTAFTVSVDWKDVTTGISAQERAETILRLVDSNSKPEDFTRPGHIFPLIAQNYGVLARAGHTEAAVDLARLAGMQPAGVICEIMNEDGSMARVPQLMEYCQKHQLKIITIADLIKYRRQHEHFLSRKAVAQMPTVTGDFKIVGFQNEVTKEHHVALIKGDISGEEPVLVRIHSECLTGDIFGSKRCDCGEQLHESLQRIEKEGRGILLYLRQEGRGIGLLNKLKAYELQEEGLDTVEANLALGYPADLRDYGVASEMLANLGVKRITLMTNNPLKMNGLKGYGIEIVERIPLVIQANDNNKKYMETKINKMGHQM